MTPSQFYAQYNGKYYEESPKLGAQCVYAFKLFCVENSIPVIPTPNNWADGYWTCQNADGTINSNALAWQEKWFEKITGEQNYRDGDWVIWGRNGASPSHPKSHIAMLIHLDGIPMEFSLNQGGNGSFCAKQTNFSDALGALRWKGYCNMNIEKGYHRLMYNGIQIDIVRATKANGYNLHLISAGDAFALQDLMSFNSDRLGIVCATNSNYFEMSNGLHLGCEGDGWTDGYFQAPKSAGVLAYYINDQGKIGAHDQSDFWLGQNEIQMVCAPYAVLIHNGENVNLRSTAFGSKDLTRNTQTCAMRIEEDWCLAIFSECYPSDVHRFAQECGANELILMDSGGSSQMFECSTTGKRREIRHTSRLLPNVLVLAKELDGNADPVPDPVPDPEPTPEPEPEPDPAPEPMPEPEQPSEEDEGIKGLLGMSNRTYDLLKWICLVVIPALCGMLTTLADQFGAKEILTVVGVLTAIATFVGTILGFSSIVYARKKAGNE